MNRRAYAFVEMIFAILVFTALLQRPFWGVPPDSTGIPGMIGPIYVWLNYALVMSYFALVLLLGDAL